MMVVVRNPLGLLALLLLLKLLQVGLVTRLRTRNSADGTHDVTFRLLKRVGRAKRPPRPTRRHQQFLCRGLRAGFLAKFEDPPFPYRQNVPSSGIFARSRSAG